MDESFYFWKPILKDRAADQQTQGSPNVINAGFEIPLSLWSIGSFAAGTYESIRELSIVKNNINYLRELKQIRDFSTTYKLGRQTQLLEALTSNTKLLQGVKAGAKNMFLLGTVIGVVDLMVAKPEERMNKVGWLVADTTMGAIGLTGWGAPIAGVYFAGRFAYALYEMR